MSSSSTIIIAREDLSIPGAATDDGLTWGGAVSNRTHFFDLLSRNKPDVIVLDFSNAPADASTDTILTIRQRSDTPILVICASGQPFVDDFRIAGATDCLPAPVDIIQLNQAIQRILRVTGRVRSAASKAPANFCFAAMRFYPGRNRLTAENGAATDLTSSEGRLLAHLLSKPWALCSRSEIGELLYGPDHNVGDRAIDVVVNRLRKKLVSIGGADAEQLIKTEFRRGYVLVADVGVLPSQPHDRPHADLVPSS